VHLEVYYKSTERCFATGEGKHGSTKVVIFLRLRYSDNVQIASYALEAKTTIKYQRSG